MKYTWYSLESMERSVAISMFALRHQVFAIEHQRSDLGTDDLDKSCQHLCVIENGEVIACLRLLRLLDSRSISTFKIGRFCVSESFRQQKIGRKMIGMALIKGMAIGGLDTEFEIDAQVYMANMYQSLGFRPIGDPYKEDDVAYITMRLSQPDLVEKDQEKNKATQWSPYAS